MKNLFTILAGVALLGISSCACAATINFADIAAGNIAGGLTVTPSGTVGYTGGELGASSIYFDQTFDAGVTASGTYNQSGQFGINVLDKYAYLDAPSGGPGGLGVCQSLSSSNQCVPNSDDNVTQNETLKLVFDTEVTLNDLVLHNGDHGTLFAGDFHLKVDGLNNTVYPLSNLMTLDLIGTTFEFFNPNHDGLDSGNFYISEMTYNEKGIPEVPIPAAVWLFGTGLIGLVAVARRKA